MATVNPPDIRRSKKYYRRNGEIIHDLDDNIERYYYDTASQVYGVQTIQSPVIPNPLVPQPAIDIVQPIPTLQSDGTVKHVLPTQQSIYADVCIHRQSKLKTIIETFPPGSICKIHLPDVDTYQTVIYRIKFSTTHLDPVLYIEFFKLEDVLALPAETSPDTLSPYSIIQSCFIYEPRQIESINSSDAAETFREFIKNEMLAIKKQIAVLKNNLRQFSRLRNSRDLTSRLVSEIDRKYHALVQSLYNRRDL